jgi:hypothetical protein
MEYIVHDDLVTQLVEEIREATAACEPFEISVLALCEEWGYDYEPIERDLIAGIFM